MTKVNIGIFGCGGASFGIHLPALLKLNDFFCIKSVYDVDNNRAIIFSEKINGCVVCSAAKEIFQDKKIDMVVILSPNHENLISEALDSRKHVFTEKPISLSIDYSKYLVKKAKDLNLVLEVGLMRMHDPVIKNFFEQIKEEHTLSAFFCKADGSDQIIRESFMPKKLKAYNLVLILS